MKTKLKTFLRLRMKYPLISTCCQRCAQVRLKHSNVPVKQPQPSAAWNQFRACVPEYDWDYITDSSNTAEIQENVHNRKGVGDIHKVLRLYQTYKDLKSASNSGTDFYQENLELSSPPELMPSEEDELQRVERELYRAVSELPNRTHPEVPIGDESCSRLITTVGTKREFDFPVRSVVKIGSSLNALKTENLGVTTGHRTYFFKGAFARLQNALVRYTVDTLLSKGFELVTVPELVHPDVIAGCGFSVSGARTQVYRLQSESEVCLAGTGEIPLAGLYSQQTLTQEDLPKRVCTVSRCYRAETSNVEDEKGIYRVHQFTKVEMFGLTSAVTGTEAGELMEEFQQIQKALFSDLGLHFRVLEMSSHELGSPAYRKLDMEAWMPHRQFWGEISSTSHCADYQSRRLGIKYWRGEVEEHAHTVNGTACAVPRLVMAIAENCQTKYGQILVPEVLQPYLGGDTVLKPPSQPLKGLFLSPSRQYRQQLEESRVESGDQ